MSEKYLVARLDEIPPVGCPCGQSRRAFAIPGNDAASVHLVEISKDARSHYHERLTEIYVVLEGEGHLELDGEQVPVRPGTAVLIRPGTRHRAVGQLKVLNISVPPFDPEDEHVV
jgi:mannose-6-phosphate isomerase-like protein (cupin superfamily)